VEANINRLHIMMYFVTCIPCIYTFLSCFDSSNGPRPALWGSFIILRHTTFVRTPLNEWSALYLYLTTHNTHKRQIAMPRRDSNPQSQQANVRISTHTARTLGSARVCICMYTHNSDCPPNITRAISYRGLSVWKHDERIPRGRVWRRWKDIVTWKWKD
jgi:hypothetical protein